MLLELAEQAGLNPQKVSSTGGGEYHSACPACGGRDRFIIQPFWQNRGRYFCRQCHQWGDSIQFCRNYLGMNFKEAKERAGDSPGSRDNYANYEIQPIRIPTKVWQKKATEFVESCCKRLLIDSEAMSFLRNKYGLNPNSARRFRLGWNPGSRFHRKSEWGLQEKERELWICLSKGIVIPSFNVALPKIKIRRLDEPEIAKYGKYQEVKGGSNLFSIYGLLTNQVALLVESELDAMCLCQEIGEFCTCLALGGATKRPDPETIRWLQSKRLVLYSLDLDDAGREQYDYWRSTFPNLRPWLAETRKSPADSFILDKVNLKAWFVAGIRHWEAAR